MEIRVLSIKETKEELKNKDTSNIKIIIASSYDADIDFISESNKIVLNFDDTTIQNRNSFNLNFAKKIHSFMDNTDIKKHQIYICCDSGISRSSAIAAAILRKYNEDENIIWNNYNYHPNLLVYKILCDEFKLKNTKIGLKRREKININALNKQINKTRKIGSSLLERIFMRELF